MVTASTDHIYRSIGSKRLDPVVFTDEDLKAFGLTRKEALQEPSKLSCLAFAFLWARELNAKNMIFIKDSGVILKNLFRFLGEWDYFSVNNPEEGDLVVYMTDDQAPKHVGVMAKGGMVHSKLGIRSAHSYLHRPFDIMPTYGRKAVFFRKAPELS